MRSNICTWLALGLATLIVSAPAHAKRTVIDQNPNGNLNYSTASGYCDVNVPIDGTNDCKGKTLPYSVHFTGFGGPYSSSSVVNYGDGRLLFSDEYGSLPADNGSLDIFGGYNAFITGGIDSSTSPDFFGSLAFNQSTSLEIMANGNIRMIAYYCVSTSSCHNTNYVLDLVPHPNGFAATVAYSMNGTESYGYDQFDIPFSGLGSSYTTVKNPAGNTFSFFIPAEISGLPPALVAAVPEPSTWMAMLVGFAMIGFTLRSRGQKAWSTASDTRIEPHRDCRRPFGLSYAAMGTSSSMA